MGRDDHAHGTTGSITGSFVPERAGNCCDDSVLQQYCTDDDDDDHDDHDDALTLSETTLHP